MTESGDDYDALSEIERHARRKRARKQAATSPAQGHSEEYRAALTAWLAAMVNGLAQDLSNTFEGSRDDTLNKSAYRIGQHLHLGVDRVDAQDKLLKACRDNGFTASERRGDDHVKGKILKSFAAGDRARVEAPALDRMTKPTKFRVDSKPDDDTPDIPSGRVKMTPFSSIEIKVPQWIWEYDDIGRIQLGTLAVFAGKPAAGKSTAVRWFASRLSKGELPGIWSNTPVRVALIMFEEQADAVVTPGLVASGANLENVFMPEFFSESGDEQQFLSVTDEKRLTEKLVDNQIRVLFVDPIMSAFGGKADIYRNNETRTYLAPFTRIAKAINGLVVGVTHLKKGEVKDVLGGINGSSAFGEVPRAVFGFAPLNDGDHVMEQVKNSAGPTGLKLGYRLPAEVMHLPAGELELPRFEITGPTAISISDISAEDDSVTGIVAAMDWLRGYLEVEQPAQIGRCKQDAKNQADINERMLYRAHNRLGCGSISVPRPDAPHARAWVLGDYKGYAG